MAIPRMVVATVASIALAGIGGGIALQQVRGQEPPTQRTFFCAALAELLAQSADDVALQEPDSAAEPAAFARAKESLLQDIAKGREWTSSGCPEGADGGNLAPTLLKEFAHAEPIVLEPK
jgi:hypothetical protein